METLVKCCMPTKCETYRVGVIYVMPCDWGWFLAALKSYASSNKLMFTLVTWTTSQQVLLQASAALYSFPFRFFYLLRMFYLGREWWCLSWLFARCIAVCEWKRSDCSAWVECYVLTAVYLMWAHLFRMGDSVQQLSVQQLCESIKIINVMFFSQSKLISNECILYISCCH